MDKEQDTSVPSTTIDTFIPGICTIYRTWDKVHSEIKGKVQDYIQEEGKLKFNILILPPPIFFVNNPRN